MEKSKEELGRRARREGGRWGSRTDSEEETEGRHRNRSEGFECRRLETTYSLILTNNRPPHTQIYCIEPWNFLTLRHSFLLMHLVLSYRLIFRICFHYFSHHWDKTFNTKRSSAEEGRLWAHSLRALSLKAIRSARQQSHVCVCRPEAEPTGAAARLPLSFLLSAICVRVGLPFSAEPSWKCPLTHLWACFRCASTLSQVDSEDSRS